MRGMRRMGLALALCLVAALPAVLAAQRPLMRGSRVRIWTEGAALVGTLQARNDTSLLVVPDGLPDTVVVPYRLIAGLEVSRGRHVRVWPMIVGVVAGGMVGGLFDGSTTSSARSDTVTAGWPTAVGMGAGALIASRFKTDSWAAINVPMPAAPRAVAAAVPPGGPTPGGVAPGVATVAAPQAEPVAAPATAAWPPAAGVAAAAGVDLAAPGEFAAGARIRYTTADLPALLRTGRLLRMDGDTLVVQPTASLAVERVPVAAVTRLDVSEGRHARTVQGLLIGAVIGSAVYTLAASDWIGNQGDFDDILAVGIFLGAPLGAGIGAAAGALTHSERWRPVERPVVQHPVSVGLSRERGRVRISLALRY